MITAAKRKSLPRSKFAYPKQRKYPIDTLKRARAALRYAGQRRTSGTYAHVAAAVRRRWGGRIKSVARKKR